ncbi:MAG: hypothetical protein GY712_01260 [Oceanicoccus sp.]|uniref:hypothetical protein n=1 Tax=Oceanicoccus sp. TaxID=2691044 RepID=UPI002633B771|nr:hypothetical protein [Oceanicoccus sp.]MCP3906630.1 hypothetical protein [Oceanicoccus sp.]MDG1773760.1 hypothetical protein [Oceanicoccus sp.]
MRIILLAALALTLSFVVSCSSSGGYNPTVFEYRYNQEKIAAKPIKKVILAPVSMGIPAPSYLRKREGKVKAMVRDYLESNGYEILPNYHFENAWKKASRTYGTVYDPSTGKIDMNAWRGAMITTGELLREQTEADAIIFADLFEHEVQHSNSMKHYARWYGVTRKPALKGSGSGVPLDFNWSRNIKAASLMVTIYDINLTPVFSSRGGIDTLYAVDLKRSTPAFVRRKSLLKSEGHIEEGIQLAFHPFIIMEDYPGKEEE